MSSVFAESVPANVWSALPSLTWFTLALIALLALRNELASLLQNLSWRLRTGAALKLFSLELGQSYVRPNMDSSDKAAIDHYTDTDDRRYNQRQGYYLPNRNIHLVHRIAPSKHAGMLYDIQIYLVAHKGATLINLNKVEYYFGKHWGKQVLCVRIAPGTLP